MGSSLSMYEYQPTQNYRIHKSLRPPSQFPRGEKWTLESLTSAAQSQGNDFSPEELQYLQEKLNGTNVELEASYEDERCNLIMDSHNRLCDYVETPFEKHILESIYMRYQEVCLKAHYGDQYRQGTEPLKKDISDAYITIDFSKVRRGLATAGSHELFVLEVMEDMFKCRCRMPPNWVTICPYSPNALTMVNFFRSVKNDDIHICPQGECHILTAILRFLPDYRDRKGEAWLQLWDTRTYVDYKNHMKIRYGESSTPMYQSFLRVDLYNLETRLRGMGVTKHEMELVNIVGQFLIEGELSQSARTWLSVHVQKDRATAQCVSRHGLPSQKPRFESSGNRTNPHATTPPNTAAMKQLEKNSTADPPAYGNEEDWDIWDNKKAD